MRRVECKKPRVATRSMSTISLPNREFCAPVGSVAAVLVPGERRARAAGNG